MRLPPSGVWKGRRSSRAGRPVVGIGIGLGLLAVEHAHRRSRSRAGPSRAAARARSTADGAVIAATGMSSKPATDTSRGTSMPQLVQPLQRAEREQVVGAADRGELGARLGAREQVVDAARAGLGREAGRRRSAARRRRCPRRPGRADSRPGARAPRTATTDRPGTRSASGPGRRARRPSTRCRPVVDADLRLARARAARGGRRPRRIRAARPRGAAAPRLTPASSRPEPAKMTPAARIERSSRTYEALARAVALDRAGDDEVAAGLGGVLDAAHDLGEVRVGDVVDDHADQRDLALEQAAGEGVRVRSRARAPPSARARASRR